jgi:ornithine carbamoyltransferase
MADLSADEVRELFDLAGELKANPGANMDALAGKVVILVTEKPSLRTRVSLEAGVAKLGGKALFFDHSEPRIGVRESIRDYAKNLERWVDCIVARTYAHTTITQLAEQASVPVVNALSDVEHPCQALADLFSLREHYGSLDGLRLSYLGDGNNVCHSLLLLCAALGVDMLVVTPEGHPPMTEFVEQSQRLGAVSGSRIETSCDLGAIEGSHAVYTDTWNSMGQMRSDAKDNAMLPFRVTPEVMSLAGRGLDAPPVFMHCLPANRGQEVTNDVIDSEQSIVYDQAENRMHTQNALLCRLLGVR